MRVVLVGGGGRETALAWRIAQSPSLERLTVIGEHPGWPAEVTVAPGGADPVDVARDASAHLVIVGPEAPLADGLANRLHTEGIQCFGPSASAARLESSKAFAKEIMAAANVPTAGHLLVDSTDPASLAAGAERCSRGSVVVKVDGLAAGKGVYVCSAAEEASDALREVCAGRFGAAGRHILLEDLLVGPEVSVFGLCDGERVTVLPAAQDHKRLLDGDRGPNTGGMGAYAPCELINAEMGEQIADQVHRPVISEMAARGMPFRGVLYAGLMLTPDGPRVLEFNVRFGDPECQPLMCLWEDDILPWLYGAASGKLPTGTPRFLDGSACCVVLASAGYPRSSTRGVPIPGGEVPGTLVFLASAAAQAGALVTAGGRVLGVTGVGADLATARERAYAGVAVWRFDGAQYRTDIAGRSDIAGRLG